VVGVHGAGPHTFGVVPPQISVPEHEPQLIEPPHPSGMLPQFLPCAWQVVGVQPHTFGVPLPPQVCGVVHEPQPSVPLQPSGIVPQFLP